MVKGKRLSCKSAGCGRRFEHSPKLSSPWYWAFDSLVGLDKEQPIQNPTLKSALLPVACSLLPRPKDGHFPNTVNYWQDSINL